tara:strand:+ start:143 stop:454 length:312 start_codon:yes stop_codon:yes gene_type:complete
MFNALNKMLLGVGIDLSTQCKVWEKLDKDGAVVNFAVFIPWQLAHLTSVADVQKSLPAGWNASSSSRDSDMREAITAKADYTPSIAIQQGANALVALNKQAKK